MYYVVGLGKSGQAFLERFPDALVWDSHLPLLPEASLNITPPLEAPWGKIRALILSPGIPHLHPQAHIAAAQAYRHQVPIWCDIEVFLQTYPSLFTVGITGTNGKSTTTALITHLLTLAGHAPLMGGNIGVPAFHLSPRTPTDICVLELSSYQLERLPSWEVNAKIGVITNITPDHLGRHGGLEGYMLAKKNILKAPLALMGIDTPLSWELYQSLEKEHPCLIPVSTQIPLRKGISVQKGILFKDSQPRLDLTSVKKLPGLHNAQNMALTFGVGDLMKIDEATILKAFHSFEGLAHRLEWVGQSSFYPIQFVNDSKATNPSATAHALAAYKDIFWIAGGQPKENELEGLEAFYSHLQKAYVIGEATERFTTLLNPFVPTQRCYTLEAALQAAWEDACRLKRGVILLSPACSSWDQYQNFEARGDHFRILAHQLLRGEK